MIDRSFGYELLQQAAERLSLDMGQKQMDALLSHLEMVIEKNRVMNLTRIEDLESGVTLHIEDSLTLLRCIENEKTFCDMGTGAGYPGIHIAIMTNMEGTLIDSVKKKANVTREFVEKLGLQDRLTVEGERVENISAERSESYDLVIARALSSLPSIIELASPLLKIGGKLLAMKARPEEEERRKGMTAAGMVGMKMIAETETTIGGEGIERRIFVYKKIGKPIIKLPRNVGTAQKKPLG